MRLSAQNFELRQLDDNNYKYFSYEGADFEICIEPNGFDFDVARYDHNGELVGKRVKVAAQKGDLPHDCFKRAVNIANGLNIVRAASLVA